MLSRTIIGSALCLFSLTISVRAEEITSNKVKSTKSVVNFENVRDYKIGQGELKGKVVRDRKGTALEISSSARGGYPGISILPPSGRWNLGAYDAVLMDVRNPEQTPVRVLLSINNPGADGRNKCNTESVTIPARGEGVLTVPYGQWHGTTGNNIDRSNIVSMRILLDQPKRSHRFTVDNIRTVTFERKKMADIYADPFYKKLKPIFGRGINLGNALEAPREGAWGVTLKESYFPEIKKAGFDSVRIPVRWSAHAQKQAPYTIDPKFFERVDWAVKNSLKNRLYVVLNMHHYEEFFNDARGHQARFLALWQQIAEHYKDYPQAVCFEPLNEPHGQLGSLEWNRIAKETLDVIRKSNPDRWVMIGPTHFNNIKKLDELELPARDKRLVVTVHYYSPHPFTHQGASWAGPSVKNRTGVRWTGTDEQKEAVRKDFDKAIAWAVEHQRPIYLGEFGVYSKAPMEDRATWTKFVADEAARRKMGTSYWEFCAGFGAYDPEKEQWRKPLLESLIPRKDP